jgi:ABC-type bacteriocin/lantibiotic exporter with double-glycine peptidase domain
LSGGEKQRLALARGFFAAKQSSILLLDEPTSSVDPENERAIYQNLFQKFSDHCIISSLHKLYLLPMFDEAYVFQDGKVLAHGTPKELLSAQGVLHPLWKRERDEAHSANRISTESETVL